MWLLTVVACGGDEVTLDGQTAGHSGGVDCSGVAPFSLDLTATAPSGLTVGFVSVTPTVPDVGDNTWVLSVSDADGPVTGLEPRVTPWMPLHGHGLVPSEYVGSEGRPGHYAIPTFDLVMPGVWEFRVDLAPSVAPADIATLTLCAEG